MTKQQLNRKLIFLWHSGKLNGRKVSIERRHAIVQRCCPSLATGAIEVEWCNPGKDEANYWNIDAIGHLFPKR